MDVELGRERRKAEMFRIYYGYGEDCPCCATAMRESPACLGLVVTSCEDCGYTGTRWEH